jgi:hypothetical protein
MPQLQTMKKASLRNDPWKPTRMGNRWFTGLGKMKRQGKDWLPYRFLAQELKQDLLNAPLINTVAITIKMREAFPGESLADNLSRAVAFVGLFDNGRLSNLYTKEHYQRGSELFGITEKG